MSDELALVIEDHEDISALFCLVLEEAGFQTEIIASGDEAVIRLADVVPDVVILDLHLPGIQGDEILHQIRTDERMAETQVIVITAYTSMARTLQDEADLVLIKPISLNLLRRLVGRLRSTDDWAGDMPSVISPGDEVEWKTPDGFDSIDLGLGYKSLAPRAGLFFVERCAALLASFNIADDAVLDVIFGKFNPGGKLPFEMPRSMEAVRAQKEDVPYDSENPLFPFGYGLSYAMNEEV